MKLRIGLDLGQNRDPTAICVAVAEERFSDERSDVHFQVPYLDRLAGGTRYPKVAHRLLQIAAKAQEKAGTPPWIYANATGQGEPAMAILARLELPGRLVPVYFNHGDQRTTDGRAAIKRVTLGKAYLVTRLKVLLQAGLLHLPKTSEARVLAEELADYEIRVDENANDREGAFQVGTHDDLVTALGLAVQVDREKVTRSGVRMRPPGL